MNLAKIEENIQKLIRNLSKEEFIYDLLLAYDLPKASITRLKEGSYNLSKKKGGTLFEGNREILWKKKLLFREVFDQDLHSSIDKLRRDEDALKHSPRFVIVTDYETLLAYDTKTKDTLDTKLKELPKHFDFFLPWSGREKAQIKLENPADVKAAEKMARLYDLIRQDNPHQFLDRESLHELNVFLSRLLFCFFAEDTEIFPKKLFVNSIESHTQADGSDLSDYLTRLFEVMNTKHPDRKEFPEYLKKFEYVNGGLFADSYKAPAFSARSRKMLIECGELNWADINPDIFGSMIQAVVHPDQRGGMGMHYTSVSNIMKVIEPLFLNELYEEFEKNQHNPQKLDKLLGRLSTIRIFDPACGSGNFLIIAYKELRLLEIKILKQLKAISGGASGLEEVQASLIPKAQMNLASSYVPQLFSRINLSQFYGIELDDFAHEIAILSLWLAEHQMNVKFNEEFQKKLPSLPLKQGGKIVCDNATRVDWDKVCPKDDKHEIYILGNPPYLGSRYQETEHKQDMENVFGSKYESLDYVSCWYSRGANYIANSNNKLAFVSTNSICQGEQVALLWPLILSQGLEIDFAHQSFKWTNNAKGKAGVICVIIGLQKCSNKLKRLYNGNTCLSVENINGYLTAASTVYISRRSRPISPSLPHIVYGNLLNDGGNLVLSTAEKDDLINKFPASKKFIRRFIGSKEFLRGEERWCLRIPDDDLEEASAIKPIKERLDKVSEVRSKSSEKSTRKLAPHPNRYYFSAHKETDSIIIPRTSSERRPYIPIGFLTKETIISDNGQVLYDAEPFIFGIISSRMHMTWVRAVAGRLKTDYRYSGAICYNNFPIPELSQKQKETITTHVFNVLEEREKHPEKTMADLYDPNKMPKDLRKAHEGLDQAVECCYRIKSFTTDEERLEYLFKLYEEMIEQEEKRKAS